MPSKSRKPSAWNTRRKTRNQPIYPEFYYVYFSDNVDLRAVLADFSRCEGIELAEPAPLHKPAFVPNDPRYNSQWFLPHCGFPDAWEISHGSEENGKVRFSRSIEYGTTLATIPLYK